MRVISQAAQWTAAARAIETEKPAPLIQDPLARYLAEPLGFKLLQQYGGAGVQEFVALRTKFLDDVIESSVNQGVIRQVVLVAAGLDTRAYRLKWPADAVVYEVDYPELHQAKQMRLDQLGIHAGVLRRVVAADLFTNWLASLYHAGFDFALPTLWIPESVLAFLTPSQASILFKQMAAVSATGSVLALDLINEDLLWHPGTHTFLNTLKAAGIPWLFGTNDPESTLLQWGWHIKTLSQPGDEPHEIGRWPYLVFPREIESVPRNWLIKAEVVTRQVALSPIHPELNIGGLKE